MPIGPAGPVQSPYFAYQKFPEVPVTVPRPSNVMCRDCRRFGPNWFQRFKILTGFKIGTVVPQYWNRSSKKAKVEHKSAILGLFWPKFFGQKDWTFCFFIGLAFPVQSWATQGGPPVRYRSQISEDWSGLPVLYCRSSPSLVFRLDSHVKL